MATLKQKTAFGPGVYRGHKLDLDKLRSYVEGTNKAIAAGISIPLLKKHAPINASDKETEQFATEHGQGSGWITRVDIEDGAIVWEAKDVPEADVADIEAGRLKFTSPEFRPHYVCEKAGVYEGPVIRHFAFTPLPGNPHQGKIETIALEECEFAFQFDESEAQPLVSQHGEDMDNVIPPPPPISDGSYSDTLTIPDHEDPPAQDDAEDESIDWDNLTVQQYNKILDEIHEGLTEDDMKMGEEARFSKEHGGEHMLHEQFGSTGNPVSWVGDEGIWDKAKKAVGSRYGGANNSRHWAVVASVYKKMGGKVVRSTQHAENDNPMDDAVKKKKIAEDVAAEDQTDNKEQQQQMPPAEAPQPDVNTNPDMPPKATDKSKLAAVLAGLNQKGIVLPSDFCFDNEAALDILLAALNSSIKAEAEAAAEAEPDEDDQNANVTDAPMPFSEQELAALPLKVREQLERLERERAEAEAKALQYEEEREIERNNSARISIAHTIAAAKIPPALKNILLNSYENGSIQFAEGKEAPTFTGAQVAEMVEAVLPPALQFEIEDVVEAEAPKANKKTGIDPRGNPTFTQADSEQFFEKDPLPFATLHVDAGRAEEIVKGSPLVRPVVQTHGQPTFSPQIPSRS